MVANVRIHLSGKTHALNVATGNVTTAVQTSLPPSPTKRTVDTVRLYTRNHRVPEDGGDVVSVDKRSTLASMAMIALIVPDIIPNAVIVMIFDSCIASACWSLYHSRWSSEHTTDAAAKGDRAPPSRRLEL